MLWAQSAELNEYLAIFECLQIVLDEPSYGPYDGALEEEDINKMMADYSEALAEARDRLATSPDIPVSAYIHEVRKALDTRAQHATNHVICLSLDI